MLNKKTIMRRILAVILPLVLILAMLPAPAGANEPEISCIGITSDLHGTYSNFTSWMETNGNSLKYMVFGGDMAHSWDPEIVNNVRTYTVSNNITPIFTMGNHDWMSGSETAFKEVSGCNRTGIQNDPSSDGFTIYTLGVPSSSTNINFKNEDIEDLRSTLAVCDRSAPFFIISHFPLHYGENRTGTNVSAMIDLLNGYPNVFFFWGHNHHNEANMGILKTAGDFITPADANTKSIKLNFTYCNSGHMGQEHGLTSGRDGTGVRAEICADEYETIVNLSFLDVFGNVISNRSVTLGQVISVTDISAPVSGQVPDMAATVSDGAAIGELIWSPIVSGVFDFSTVYSVCFLLTSTSGIPFTPSTIVTVNGMPANCILNGDGSLTVTCAFPKTSPDPKDAAVFVKTSTICDGKEYAIALDGVALNSDMKTGSSSYYSYTGLSYTVPVIDGDYLTIYSPEEAEKATWIFESAGEDSKWYIRNDTEYLYAVASRNLTLSDTAQVWTYGELSNKGTQLYTQLSGNDCNLYYGGVSTADLVYPSSNNKNTLTLYEKISISENSVGSVSLELAAPSAGSVPDTEATVTAGEATAGYVLWSPAVPETFDYDTVYTASVTLTAFQGFFFSQATAVTFNGSAAYSKHINADGTLTAAFKFPATALDPDKIVTFIRTDTITDGHEYAIVFDDVAMNNTAASESRYTGLSYTIPDIDGDILTIYSYEEADKATWTFSSAGEDNKWFISNGDDYLSAPASRTLDLSETKQAWTYGELGEKGVQLYVQIDGKDNNLCYGSSTTADLVYPSANNYNTLTVYEKVIISENDISSVVLELTAPSAGSVPDNAADVIKGEATAGEVIWYPEVEGTFGYDTVYTANIPLSPNSDYRFTDATVIMVNGSIAKKNLNKETGILTAEFEFPATSSDPGITVKYVRTESITGSSEYAITFDGYAMNSVSASGSYNGNQYTGLSYFTPVIDGDILIFSSGAEAKAATWTFTGADDDGKWYISIGGKYLYAPATRALELNDSPQAWTYDVSGDDGAQLTVQLDDRDYSLFNGRGSTADLIYPSSNNSAALILYEKIEIHNEAVQTVAVTGITAPEAGSAPDTNAEVSPEAVTAGTVSWSPAVNGSFAYNTIYTAGVVLTPQSGYYFTEDTTATVNGYPASSLTLNSDGTLTVKYAFPITAPDPTETFIENVALSITAPEAGSAPDTNAVVTQGEVTAGAVTWSPSVEDTFDYDTVYSAAVTLTAADGYYLTDGTVVTINGLAASGFTVNIDGTLTVVHYFPATAHDPTQTLVESIALSITAPEAGSVPDTYAAVKQGEVSAGTVTWSPSVEDTFDYDTVYTAVVTLTAADGYYLTEETVVTVNDQAATGTAVNSDGTLTAEFAFPATAPDSSETHIGNVALSITAPEAGSVPDTYAVVKQGEVTMGTVIWSPHVKNTFAYSTVYTAHVTLNAKSGYYLTEDTLVTVNGHKASSRLNENGTLAVSFVFQSTESKSGASGNHYAAYTSQGRRYFWDVPKGVWFYSAVQYVVQKGILEGATLTSFAPNSPMARALFVQISYEFAGFPESGPKQKFSDVASDMWYTDAIAWASANGIIKGYSQEMFGPENYITREQLITILFRCAKYKGYINNNMEIEYGSIMLPYPDANKISEYAVTAIKWAYNAGMLENAVLSSENPNAEAEDGFLRPRAIATRAEIADFLMRYHIMFIA